MSLQRIQRIVLPILRGQEDWTNPVSIVSGLEGVTINSWMEDIDYRTFPLITVRRIGGSRNPNAPLLHALPVVEIQCHGMRCLEDTEDMYERVLDTLYRAVKRQTITEAGVLSSIDERGVQTLDSPFPEAWRVQGLIQLGNRARRNRS